ncbi:MAG: hypothetical protein ACI857_001576 [Arenicella sp.]|jgi:hypothetical protein
MNKDFEKILLARINQMAEFRKPIASNPDSHFKVYLQATILNEFNYLEFTLISPVQIKTMGGCKLTFKSTDSEFVLKSESDIISSDYSRGSKIGITLVDTDLDKEFGAFVKSNVITSIQLHCKAGQIFKKTVSVSYTDIDMKVFISSLVPKQAEATGQGVSAGGGSSMGI